jgi:hypothetical protein
MALVLEQQVFHLSPVVARCLDDLVRLGSRYPRIIGPLHH